LSPDGKNADDSMRNRKDTSDSVFGLSSEGSAKELERKPSDFNALSNRGKPQLKLFLDSLVDENTKLHTRNQKMQMVQDMIMNYQYQASSK